MVLMTTMLVTIVIVVVTIITITIVIIVTHNFGDMSGLANSTR